MISDDELKEVMIGYLRSDDGQALIREHLSPSGPLNPCALCDLRCGFLDDARACPMIQASETLEKQRHYRRVPAT